jgi:restriction system protein
MNQIPTFDALMAPLYQVIKELGGSASIEEMEEKAGELLNLSEQQLEQPHNPEKSNQTEFGYRLAWARTYLKQYGVIQNSSRGIWVIAKDVAVIDPQVVVRTVREQYKQSRGSTGELASDISEEELPDVAEEWRSQLYKVLVDEISPAAFERLVQRLLRESGFVHVEVTGRTGDGGIDGKGIVRVSGLLSFHVNFQCKKYAGTVSASHVRDFRGAMVGRADKGLFITTGSFSRDAIKEATRDGAPPLDLIDGEQLAEMLKELRLGISVQTVEKVLVDAEWFRSI